MISFVVPAHNEELWIGRCLGSIRAAMADVGEPFEVIVVDDASTDATAQIAAEAGARTLSVSLRNIAAVRNAGAREANGDLYFFVDADTQANAAAVKAALAAMRSGAAGGGCAPQLDGPVPPWARGVVWFSVKVGRIIKLVGGCFVFCTREAFAAAGGFDEQHRAGEDIAFVRALKKVGRFVVPGPTVVTSGRKLDVAGPFRVITLLLIIAVRGPNYESPWVIDILYGRRAQNCRRTENVGTRNCEVRSEN